ncbi:MAG: DEAD/DEAH box helicase family protein [Bacteroidales bacterium]|nr:DEAD/DEAH box helicase family protein [Bacteroidales bacterium]
MPRTWVQYDKELPYLEDRQPWEKPLGFLRKTGPNQFEVVEGRRISKMLLVNKLRHAVDHWREEGYPGATETSKELLIYWFDQSHPPVFGNEPFHYYFCQREAIETIIYLFEVKKYDDLAPLIEEFQDIYPETLFDSSAEISVDMDGKRRIKRYFPELEQVGEQDMPEENLLRYAVKMATGAGKTYVMAFVIVWSYFNRIRENKNSYADNFLVVAPNRIVYERLVKDFAGSKIFYELPYIPDAWKSLFKLNIKTRGDESPLAPGGNLIVNNIQQLYESRIKEWKPDNIINAILGPKMKDPAKPPMTLLERIKELDNMLVINDEAHHVHDDELKWNESLLSIHNTFPKGLMMWLDFSATPKTPDGTYYPWIICDYPLAQAVEDRIVKTPLIVHTVNKREPEHINKDNVVAKYSEWILAALTRWKQHYEAFHKIDKKPVLFIMAEKNDYADKLAEGIKKIARTDKQLNLGIKDDEVLIIHTDRHGDVKDKDLESLREDARDVDQKDNRIKVIVSVLMLREGWDVQNVTIVLGLRAFDSPILPEQAIGRGLRLMRNISPDRTQTLEVIGNNKFEEIVRQLEKEGVGINTENTPPPLPVTIAPEKNRIEYDITIPATNFSYNRIYQKIGELDPMTFPSLFDSSKLSEETKFKINIRLFELGTQIHEEEIKHGFVEISQEIISTIVVETMKKARLTECFHILYPIIETYIKHKCFKTTIEDLENIHLRRKLREIDIQEAITDLLSTEIGKATAEKKNIQIEGKAIKLSDTPKFTWRRKHQRMVKTVFNFVAAYNNFELDFAKYLDNADDIEAFAALANIFKIDYLTSKGAIRYYFPDFIAVQTEGKKKIFWILETKGREYPELDQKNNAIKRWVDSVSAQTKQTWRYVMVKQGKFEYFKKSKKTKFADLLDALVINDQNKTLIE